MQHSTPQVTDRPASPPRHRGRRKLLEHAAYPDDFEPRHCGCSFHQLKDAFFATLIPVETARARLLARGGVAR